MINYKISLLCLLSLIAFACQESKPSSTMEKPTSIQMWEEPMHKLVLSEGDLKVLDIQIPAGDTTQFHLYGFPTVYVVINDAMVGSQLWEGDWTYIKEADLQKQGTSIDRSEDYNDDQYLHRMHNKDKKDFRLIGLVHQGSGKEGEFSSGFLIENNWFKEHRYELKAGQESGPINFENKSLVVQFEDGISSIVQAGSVVQTKNKAGDFFLQMPNEEYSILNNSAKTMTYIIWEVK